jgi:hypothetical protein
VAEKSDDVRECASASPRRAWRAELTGQAHSAEREERGERGNSSATGDPGPRDRERESGGEKLASTDRPHWAASEGGRARAKENCR